MNVLVIHGPNLNMLGHRNSGFYGTGTYDDLISFITEYASEHDINTEFFQSNHEGDIIDRIQKAYIEGADGMIINAGAYSHYSYAIRDALEICRFPKVEVHISDVTAREAFRKNLVLSEVCDRTIYGKGYQGYAEALDFILDMKHII